MINELIRRGRRCIIVYAAAAEVVGEPRTIVRQQEALDACNVLGLNTILYLDFCEPKYVQEGARPLVRQEIEDVCEALKEILFVNQVENPFVLVSYDSNGGYGNLDHRMVHEAGVCFKKKYPHMVFSLMEVTINRDEVKQWLANKSGKVPDKNIPKLSYWAEEFGLAREEITYNYVLSSEQKDLKRRALGMHKSQMSLDEFPLVLSDDDFGQVFGAEFLKIYLY